MSIREAVLDRRMMVEMKNGRIRLSDWNRVNTVVGAGWEPRTIQFLQLQDNADQGVAVDLDDDINRIDGFDFDFDWLRPYHVDPVTKQPLIGGYLMLGRPFAFSDDAVST